MNAPERNQRLRAAIAAAAANLEGSHHPLAQTGPTNPGDVFVFSLGDAAAVQWLVVRDHSEIQGLFFLVPTDSFPLAGSTDIALGSISPHGPLTARCKYGLWLPSTCLATQDRVGGVSRDTLGLICRQLDSLSKDDQAENDEQRQVDADPEYVNWMQLVEGARQRLQLQTDMGGLCIRLGAPPREPAKEVRLKPRLSFLLAPPREAHAAAAMPQANLNLPNEVSLPGMDNLLLISGEEGVRAVWKGSPNDAPKLAARGVSGDFQTSSWQTGGKGAQQSAAVAFPWINDRVVIAVGAEPLQTVVIQR